MCALGSTITTIFLLKFGQVNTLNPQADKVTAQVLRSWGTGCKPEACNWCWCTAKYLLQHNRSLDLSEGVYRYPWYKIAQIEVAPEASKDTVLLPEHGQAHQARHYLLAPVVRQSIIQFIRNAGNKYGLPQPSALRGRPGFHRFTCQLRITKI